LHNIKEKLKEKIKPSKAVEQGDVVLVIKDRKNIHSRLASLFDKVNKSILIASTEEGLKRKIIMHETTLRAAKKRGVDIRIIGPADAEIIKGASRFAKINNRDNIHRVVIVDDTTLLFLGPEEYEKESSIWIKSPYFAESMRRLF
jgi:sugar-specific transcriptional regulator TrmB